MSAITITISPTRTLVADGRLVAGESADVSVVGGVASKLYLVDPGREVVAACESFVPGESSATGVLNLATVPLAKIVSDVPAGYSINLSCLIEDAGGDLIGYGFVPLVSAPMPDALDPLDDDYIYAKFSDLQAYLTRAEAAATYATRTALSDVAGQAAQAENIASTALNGLNDLADVARTGSYNDLTDTPTIPTVPVQSVNGQTGAVVLTASDVGAAPAADLRYALGPALIGSGQLADRTCNHVIALADNVADIVLTFPDVPSDGGVALLAARDFLVLVTNRAGNTGNITFTPPTGAVVYGDGFTNAPASGETWLYSVTEVAVNVFWVKSAKMEVAQ